MLWIVIICTASAMFGAVAIVALTELFPLSRGTAGLLQVALGQVEQTAAGPLPGVGRILQGRDADNVFAAATNGDVLPLTSCSPCCSRWR